MNSSLQSLSALGLPDPDRPPPKIKADDISIVNGVLTFSLSHHVDLLAALRVLRKYACSYNPSKCTYLRFTVDGSVVNLFSKKISCTGSMRLTDAQATCARVLALLSSAGLYPQPTALDLMGQQPGAYRPPPGGDYGRRHVLEGYEGSSLAWILDHKPELCKRLRLSEPELLRRATGASQPNLVGVYQTNREISLPFLSYISGPMCKYTEKFPAARLHFGPREIKATVFEGGTIILMRGHSREMIAGQLSRRINPILDCSKEIYERIAEICRTQEIPELLHLVEAGAPNAPRDLRTGAVIAQQAIEGAHARRRPRLALAAQPPTKRLKAADEDRE